MVLNTFEHLPSFQMDPESLKQAKTLFEWPEWECMIKAELDQLQEKKRAPGY